MSLTGIEYFHFIFWEQALLHTHEWWQTNKHDLSFQIYTYTEVRGREGQNGTHISKLPDLPEYNQHHEKPVSS